MAGMSAIVSLNFPNCFLGAFCTWDMLLFDRGLGKYGPISMHRRSKIYDLFRSMLALCKHRDSEILPQTNTTRLSGLGAYPLQISQTAKYTFWMLSSWEATMP
jgi:hypothetical protein